MTSRMQITIDDDLRQRVEKKAKRQGVPFAEIVRQALQKDVGQARPVADVEPLFDLVKTGAPTNIGRDKKKMIGESIAWKPRK